MIEHFRNMLLNELVKDEVPKVILRDTMDIERFKLFLCNQGEEYVEGQLFIFKIRK